MVTFYPLAGPGVEMLRMALLRLRRAALIADAASEAELANRVKHELWG
jgi:hypothetical protein